MDFVMKIVGENVHQSNDTIATKRRRKKLIIITREDFYGGNG